RWRMKVRYTPQARADLDEIFSYVSQDNPPAASQLIAKIRNNMLTNPSLGRRGRVAGTRELVIVGYPYIAAYRLHKSTVEVLAVIHTSRSWPDEF
ncbi:MAG: type II toxin-antitoxin system RelE/ParE family toxin, partial [Gammaproteobacteria bacterium]